MKRFYYVTSQIKNTEEISEDMHSLGISDWNFHVLSKDKSGLIKRHINSTNYYQECDLIHSALRGAIIGFVAFLAFSLAINYFSGFEALSMQLLLLLGVLIGSWLGAVIGWTHENYKIVRFHDDIEAGKYLIMVDAHKDEEYKVRRMMANYHPEAQMSGEDTTLINPFEGHMGAAVDAR